MDPLLGLVWFAVGSVVLAVVVAIDARERGQRAVPWFLLALLFPGFGALAYLVRRAPSAAASAPPAVTPATPPPTMPTAAAVARGASVVAPTSPSGPPASATAAPSRPASSPTSAPDHLGNTLEWRRG